MIRRPAWMMPLAVVAMLAVVGWFGWARPSAGNSARSAASDPPLPPGGKKTVAGVTPADSDVLRISYWEDPATLNPVTAGDLTSGYLQSFVYESLAEASMADPDRLEPRLAERWEFDESLLEYTIHLRHGVKWHPLTLPNGESLPAREVTTRDVQFTFDCVLNPHIPAAQREDFEDAEATSATERRNISLTVIDDYTFKVRWKKPYFLSESSTMQVQIIPRHVFSVDEQGDLISLDFSSKEFAEGFNNHWAGSLMCGTGPLTFDRWDRDERIVLKRNPTYWGPPIYFSRIVFSCESNSYTLLQKLLQGEVDWADIDGKDLYRRSLQHPRVESGEIVMKTYDFPGYKYIGYNLRRHFLRDKQVRRALTHAIPIEQIINVVFDGLATQVTGPFQLQSKAYNHAVNPLAFDLERAQRLLDKAGWRDSDRNGVRDKLIDGKRVEARVNLMIESNSPQYLTVAQIIQSNWRRIGVRADITPANEALMTQRTRAKDFDAVLRGWSQGWRADPYQTWFSGRAELADTSNIIGYKNTEVDQLVTKLRVTFDPQQQLTMYHQIHALLYDDQPYTFLFSEKQTCGYNGRLKNIRFYHLSPCFDVRQWYSFSEP